MTTRTASAEPTPLAYATGCRPRAARIACRSAASPTAARTPASRPSGSGTTSSRHWASKRSSFRCLASSAWHRRHRSICVTSSACGSPPASSCLSISRATWAQSSEEGSRCLRRRSSAGDRNFVSLRLPSVADGPTCACLRRLTECIFQLPARAVEPHFRGRP